MKLNVQAVNFDMAQKLNEFIQKKTQKYNKSVPDSEEMVIHMKVVKPETNMNKETQIRLGNIFVSKMCDTFEEGILQCLEVVERQLEKAK